MKAKPTSILALSVASAAALLLGVGASRADGLPARAPAPAAYTPVDWSGLYIGFESGWDWDHTDVHFPQFGTRSSWDRDVINAGLYGGYQHQWGPLVLGVEFSLIGNQFDNADSHKDVAAQGIPPAASTTGNCPNPTFNCVGRITDVFTLGPRLGWAAGNFMPYLTGGWATGSYNFRVIPDTGVASEWADGRAYGWYAGGGLDYKIAQYAVIGIEYRHVDLGSVTENTFNNVGEPVELVRMRGDSDMVLLRGALLFDPRPAYAPMK